MTVSWMVLVSLQHCYSTITVLHDSIMDGVSVVTALLQYHYCVTGQYCGWCQCHYSIVTVPLLCYRTVSWMVLVSLQHCYSTITVLHDSIMDGVSVLTALLQYHYCVTGQYHGWC